MAIEEKIPRATEYAGEIKIGDLVIPCAVLEDGTRLLSERGMTKALGGKRGGSHWRRRKAGGEGADLPVFASSPNLIPYIDSELYELLLAPMKYLSRTGQKIGYGREATILPRVCDVWLKARDAGALHPSQVHIARNADILMRGLAHVGIIALVDEATGYQDVRDRDELQRILEAYVNPILLPWAKRFPEEYYKELFRLHGWQYSPMSVKRPQLLAKRTNEIVYDRLPPRVKEELRKKNPTDEKTKRRKHKLHQFLTNETGIPHLDRMLAVATAFLSVAPNYRKFLSMYNRAIPKPGTTMLIPFPERDDEAIDV